MGSFLLLDVTEQAITLCWERDEGVNTEEVQMKVVDAGDGAEWVTLSKELASSALRKKKLEAGTLYVFRRRPKLASGDAEPGKQSEETEDWGPWSESSESFRTLSAGARQPRTPDVKLREAGALVMEWEAVPGASGYEVQMSASGAAWTTIAPSFGSVLLRKKGLEDSKQYRFRVRPVFEPADEERGGDEWGWSPASALASPAVLNAFLASQIPEELVVRGKKTVNRTVLAGKIVAFYFSASWCGPCRKYTPQLAALYAQAKAQHKAFEVVFVSLDSDERSMLKYHDGMPWPAVPFDHPFREDFASSKGVNSVPRLIITGRRGQELASNAVGMTWDQLVAWEAQ